MEWKSVRMKAKTHHDLRLLSSFWDCSMAEALATVIERAISMEGDAIQVEVNEMVREWEAKRQVAQDTVTSIGETTP